MTTTTAQQARELVRNFFPPERGSEHSRESLASILEDFVGAMELATRLDAFVELKAWTASRSPSPAGNGVTRLETVLALIESQSELRVRFQQEVREILTEVRSVELFAEAGLHRREGLWSEGGMTIDGGTSAFGTGRYRPFKICVPDLSHEQGH